MHCSLTTTEYILGKVIPSITPTVGHAVLLLLSLAGCGGLKTRINSWLQFLPVENGYERASPEYLRSINYDYRTYL